MSDFLRQLNDKKAEEFGRAAERFETLMGEVAEKVKQAMTNYEIRELSFRGHPYKIACTTKVEQDPSWFSFDDESGVRDRDWDIKPGDVVFDIGSAYGSYALTALASGAAHVVCFNPNRDENAVLADSYRANVFDGGMTVRAIGLWSKAGYLRDTDQHFVDSEETKPDGHFPVQDLDLFLAPDRVDWMKLDVEGAEVEVLKGAEQTIRRFKPRILVELHLFKDATLGTQVTELLASYGYRKVSEHPYHSVSHALYESNE